MMDRAEAAKRIASWSADRMQAEMRKVWVHVSARGIAAWEPPDAFHPLIERAVEDGYLRRMDGRFLFERMKDSHVGWTPAALALFKAAEAA